MGPEQGEKPVPRAESAGGVQPLGGPVGGLAFYNPRYMLGRRQLLVPKEDNEFVARLVEKWYPLLQKWPPYPESMTPDGAWRRSVATIILENQIAWWRKRQIEDLADVLEQVRVKRGL